MKKLTLLFAIAAASLVAGCATRLTPPPEIRLDEAVAAQPVPEPAKPIEVVSVPEPLPLPDQLKPLVEDRKYWPPPESVNVPDRVARANREARIAPTREGY